MREQLYDDQNRREIPQGTSDLCYDNWAASVDIRIHRLRLIAMPIL